MLFNQPVPAGTSRAWYGEGMKHALAALLAVVPMLGAVKILSETANGNRTARQTMIIDSDKMRADMTSSTGESTSVMFLTDGGRDRFVLLDTAKNEYREIDQQTMKRMSQQMQGAMTQLNERLKNLTPEQRAMMEKMMKGQMPPGMGQVTKQEPVVYKATGSGNVNGFACTMYQGTRGGEKVVEVCAAQPNQLKVTAADMQVFERLKQFTAEMTSAIGNFASAAAQFADVGVPGFPVSRVTYNGGQVTHKSEVKSVGRAALTGSEFSTGGAKKAEFMPGARKR